MDVPAPSAPGLDSGLQRLPPAPHADHIHRIPRSPTSSAQQGPRVRIRSPHIRCAASKAPAPAGQGPDGFPFSLSGVCVFSQREGNGSGHRISLTRGAASPRFCQPWPGTAGVPRPSARGSTCTSPATPGPVRPAGRCAPRAGAPRPQVRPVGRYAPSAGPPRR